MLTHGSDHAGRVVRSKGEAGWRMHRCRCGQHVAGVTEGGNVADGGHVSGEGGRVKGAALGKVFEVVMDLFALFGLARHLSVSGLNSFFLHSQGSVNLNKNQLFFFVLPSLLPKSPWDPCTPHPTPAGPAGHCPPPPNLSFPSQNSDPSRKSKAWLKFLKTRQKIAGRATQEQNIPE